MGKTSKQHRKRELSLAFLDWRQRTYPWDDEAPDINEGLVEDNTGDLADVPAELPGVELESNYDNVVIVADPQPPAWAIAEQVLTNANLTPPGEGAEITGVNIPHTSDDTIPPLVTDDEHGDDDSVEAVDPLPLPAPDVEDLQADDHNELDDEEASDAGEALFENEAETGIGHDHDEDSGNDGDEESDQEDEEVSVMDQEPRRHPLQKRKKKNRQLSTLKADNIKRRTV